MFFDSCWFLELLQAVTVRKKKMENSVFIISVCWEVYLVLHVKFKMQPYTLGFAPRKK